MGCGSSSVAPDGSSRSSDPPKTKRSFERVKTLGIGASCHVDAVKEKASSTMYAMKVMDKDLPTNRQLWETERAILKLLRHPNILELVDAYEDRDSFKIITKYCQGGELFDRVQERRSFSEQDAARLTREMLSAVAYCHKHNVVHRDLKPENFVFETADEDSAMRLIDFGCAKLVADDEFVHDYAGSAYYVAPEVLDDMAERTGAVWKACDMWSIGVIVFLFVCGYPPFNGNNTREIFRAIKKGRYSWPSNTRLSDGVKDLIQNLLKQDPKERLSAEAALTHPWVGGEAPDTPLDVLTAIGAFRSHCRLKKAVGRVMVNRMTEDDHASLAEAFRKFDTNGDGRLGPDEIAAMMKFIGRNESEAKEMIRELDDNKDGSISIDEFATAQMLGKLTIEAEIKKTFDLFDRDGDGVITQTEIEKMCEFLTPEAARNMIKEVDKNGDGEINFSEFLMAMQEQKALATPRPTDAE